MAPVIWSGAGLLVVLAGALADRGGRRARGDLRRDRRCSGLALFALVPYGFVFGVLRSRVLQAGAVTEFLHRIGDGPDPSDLRDLLSTALGDRSLQVVYWLDRPRRWVDAAGHPAVLPGDDDPARAVTRVEREGRAVGALIHDRSLCEDPELVGSVAAAAGLSIENERLQAQLRARVEELRASRARIVAAGTAERRRLERNLHDGAQQRLVALSLTLRVAQSRLHEDPDGAEAMIAGAQEELTLALAELRELARGIHPAVLSDRGLEPALAALAGRSPVPVEVARTPDERLPPAVEAAAYFVVAEALTNVAKYAGRLAGADLDLAHQRPRRRGGRRRRRRRGRSDPRIGAARPRRPGLRPRRNARVAVTAGRGDRASCFDPRMSDPIRVVIADDSVLLREGLARLLEEFGFEVAAQAGDAEDLLRKVGSHKPDVAVVDVRMPPTHTDEGLRAAHEIRATHPDTGVLVLSQYVEEAYALELLSESTESTGYLLKDRVADVDSFTDAVRRVANGGSALDPEVVALLLGRRRREDPLQSITPREREVLGLMAEGRSNAAIAEALVVTERAVEKHVTSIFSKLDLTPAQEDHRRVLAVLAYLRAA